MRLRSNLAYSLVALGSGLLAVVAVVWVMNPASKPSNPMKPGVNGQHEPATQSAGHGIEHRQEGPSPYELTEVDLLRIQGERGSAAALAELERRIKDIPELAGMCHALTHALGHAAIAASGGSVTKALKEGDEVCGNGFTHGVIETALAGSTDPAGDLLRICAPAQDGSCFHGVGHGLMFATGMDVEASLDLCEGAPEPLLVGRCGEGVFMQLFSADLAAGHSANAESAFRVPTSGEVAGICDSIRVHLAGACWFYGPTVYLTEHPDDFVGALRWCRANGSGIETCAKGVGSRAVKFHPDDLRVGDATCWAAGLLRDACYRGMGSYWSVHWKGDRDPRDVCSTLQDGHRQACRRAMA